MKTKAFSTLALLLFAGAQASGQSALTRTDSSPRTLVVYFSATGTTAFAARKIAAATDGTLCEIVPEKPYTSADLNWRNERSRSSVEMNDAKARPAIRPAEVRMEEYDVVFLGYPVWWNLAPRIVNSFIEQHDLSGKRIIPFATSGSSSIAGSVAAIPLWSGRPGVCSTVWARRPLTNGHAVPRPDATDPQPRRVVSLTRGMQPCGGAWPEAHSLRLYFVALATSSSFQSVV